MLLTRIHPRISRPTAFRLSKHLTVFETTPLSAWDGNTVTLMMDNRNQPNDPTRWRAMQVHVVAGRDYPIMVRIELTSNPATQFTEQRFEAHTDTTVAVPAQFQTLDPWNDLNWKMWGLPIGA